MKYLGRVHKLDMVDNRDVSPHSRDSFDAILDQIIENNLSNFRFRRHNKEYLRDNFSVNLETKKVCDNKNKREVSLQMNEGFLNTYTLRQLLNFKPKGDVNQIAFNLANAFVSAGINLPQDIFIQIYTQLLKEHKIKNPFLEQTKQQPEDFDADNFHY